MSFNPSLLRVSSFTQTYTPYTSPHPTPDDNNSAWHV